MRGRIAVFLPSAALALGASLPRVIDAVLTIAPVLK
jgi:hypothetical protein